MRKAPAPRNNNGSIVLRFRSPYLPREVVVSGLGSYTNKSDLTRADAIADRLYSAHKLGESAFLAELHPLIERKVREDYLRENHEQSAAIDNFADFTKHEESRLGFNSTRCHRTLLNKLTSTGDKSIETAILTLLLNGWLDGLETKTLRNYLGVLNGFNSYLEKHGIKKIAIPDQLFDLKKIERKKEKPFSIGEINQIILWFGVHAPHYLNFVRFRFLTGVRSGEIAGLRWADIDSEGIHVYESITQCGENGKLARKSTKTGKGRILPLNNSLEALLNQQKEYLQAHPKLSGSTLIFPNQYGNPVNSAHFSSKYWTKCLVELGIEHRSPYTSRHTYASHVLSEGMLDPLSLAKLLGHDERTLFRNYASAIDKKSLPDLGI